MKFFPLRSLCVWLAVLAWIVPGYAQAPAPTPFGLEGIFNNKGELGLESVRNVALSQSTATPFYKSNGLETRFYEGDFKAAADTSQLAILSDDGTSVWIDGQKVLDGADKGQGFENFDLTFHVLAKSFIKDRLYHLRLQYTNTIHRDDADVDGLSLWAYGGGGSIIPPKPLPPDIAIRAVDEDENAFLGLGQHDPSGASQVETGLTVPGSALVYIVKLRNGTGATQKLKLSAPADANGWTTRFYDGLVADETKNITAAALQDGWPVELASGAEREVRVEVMPSDSGALNRLVPVTLALADDATNKDVARINASLQKVAQIEISLDAGKTWVDAPLPGSTDVVTVTQYTVLGVRAKRANLSLPWPDEPFKPEWKRGADSHVGAEAYLYFPDVTPAGEAGEEVQAECGNSLSLRVRVLADE